MRGVGTALQGPRKGASGVEGAPKREGTGSSRALSLAIQGPSGV